MAMQTEKPADAYLADDFPQEVKVDLPINELLFTQREWQLIANMLDTSWAVLDRYRRDVPHTSDEYTQTLAQQNAIADVQEKWRALHVVVTVAGG